MSCSDDCWSGWTWFWLVFFIFFFILLICWPTYYYYRSDYCGTTLPPERYQVRPARVVEVATVSDDPMA